MNGIDINILLKYISKQADISEIEFINEWLEKSEANRDEFLVLKKIHLSYKEVSAIDAIEEGKSWERLKLRTIDKKKKLRVRIFYQVAAVLLPFLIVIGLLKNKNIETSQEYLFNKNLTYIVFPDGTTHNLLNHKYQEFCHPKYGTIYKDSTNLLAINSSVGEKEANEQFAIVTPLGAEYDFFLSDGSKVILNSMSKISYPINFKNDIREISLTGEAFLEVSKDKKRPFIVEMQFAQVKVLGTSFNISAYESDEYNEITLVEGHVKVNNGSNESFLIPGKQAICSCRDVISVRDVDVNIYTSWTRGIFEFNKMSLKKITTSLERWYNIKFNFTDNAIENKKFTGAFKKGTPIESILNFIEETTNVKFIKKNDLVYVVEK
ncbi:FecR family protein [Labilibaculum euxinus]